MGCVTSKHLKKQAICDGYTSPASKTVARSTQITSCFSIECYHHHSVSLTSTTYGSLNVESSKCTTEPVAFPNEICGSLRSLKKGDSVNSRAMEGCANITHSPVVYRVPERPPLALQSSYPWRMSSAELGLPETINVNEMMMGLEEAVPLSKHSSPAKYAHSNASTSRTKALQQHNRNLKRKAEDPQKITHDTSMVKKGVAATLKGCSKEDTGSGKENKAPLHGQHIKCYPLKIAAFTESPVNKRPLSQVSNVLYKPSNTQTRETCTPVATSPLSQQETIQAAQKIEPLWGIENTVPRKLAFEKGQSFTSSWNNKCSPGLSSGSMASMQSVHYAPSTDKVRLTVDTHHSDQSGSIVETPSPLPTRSMSRRLVFGAGGPDSSGLTSPTFDPELVASYEKALSDVSQIEWNATHKSPPKNCCFSAETGITHVSRPWRWSRMSLPVAELDRQIYNPLECFDVKCPPGGTNALVLYTTTLRGIRKTFEDCNTAREILDSFNLSIDERDVSMHLDFLNELRELMGRVVSVPRLFIRGRYIGGIEMVVRLHEDGKLSELVEGLLKRRDAGTCDGCGGIRFVPCLECSGSCKLRCEHDDDRIVRCPDCNENGLIQCPICT